MPKYPRSNSYAGQKASSSKSGQAKFATAASAAAGTATDEIISPATLAGAVDDLLPDASQTVKGKVELATAAEMSAGTDEERVPAVKVAFDYINSVAIAGAPAASESVSGIAEIATTAEAVALTDDLRIMTPAKVADVFAAPPALGSGTPAAGSFSTLAATGAVDFDAGGSFESGGAAIDIGADASADAINIGTGAAARTITMGNVTGATALALNAGTGGIALASTGAGDITLNSDDTLLLDADGVLELNSSGGVISIGNDADAQNINVGTGAAARTITIGNGTGATSLVLDCGTGALNIGTNAIAHTVTVGNSTGASALVLACGTGNFSLDGAAASTYAMGASTTTGTISIGGTAQTGTITLGDSSGTNTVQIGSGEGATTVAIAGGATSGKTVTIADGAVANSVTIGSATGASSLSLLCGTGNFSLDGAATSTYALGASTTSGTITIGGTAQTGNMVLGSSSGTNTVSVGAGEGATTVAIAGGATNGKTVTIADGAVANSVTIGSATGASSLSLLCGTGNYSLDGAGASTYTVGASTTSGTISIGGTAQTGTMTLGDSSGTNTVQIGSGEGATTVNIAGGATNAKTVNIATGAVANAVTIGSSSGAASLALLAGTGQITVTGTVKEIDAEFLYASGTDVIFNQSPVCQSNATTGVAPTGSNGDVNLVACQDGLLLEQFIIGTQTIIAPRMSANGLSIELDQTDNEGAEYNFGAARSNSKHAFTVGTDAAFFVEAEIYVEDMSGCEPLILGFRKSAANNADYTTYTDFYGAGLNNGTSATEVSLFSQLNSGGVTVQASGDNWGGDGTTCVLKVLVSASGVCSVEIDGSAASTPLAQTFDSADVVVPFIHFLHDTTSPGEIALVSFKCGYQ